MNYGEAVHYLYSLGNEVKTAKLGLERITTLLNGLGNPHRAGRFVHVAGTNGKGSTCAMIESGLRAAGVRTGLYTSPHLVEPAERIQIAGAPATPEQFAAAFAEVHETAESMLRADQIDLHPTYFETVTAMAFLLFRKENAEIVVLETGLGGRLDATNVVVPELCAITPVDLDHQEFLGDTLQQIAGEKAGIMKPRVPVVIARQHWEADRVLLNRAAELEAPVIATRDWPVTQLELNARGSRFVARDLAIACPLAGEHQVDNALTAALALRQLGFSVNGIAQARWPGRLERISEQPEIILDGAHNIAGAEALARYIERFYGGRKIWLIYGVMRDKPVEEMTHILFPLADRIVATAANNSRAMPPEEIATLGGGRVVEVTRTVSEAVTIARRAAPENVVFITGSLFVAGEARALLLQ